MADHKPARARIGGRPIASLLDPLPMPDEPPPANRPAPAARQALALLGGIAGVHAISEQVARGGKLQLTPRQVRDLLKRDREIDSLGAGLFALSIMNVRPVIDLATAWLTQVGPAPVNSLVDLLVERYPRADPRAVRPWVHQEPGRLQVDGSTVRLRRARW